MNEKSSRKILFNSALYSLKFLTSKLHTSQRYIRRSRTRDTLKIVKNKNQNKCLINLLKKNTKQKKSSSMPATNVISFTKSTKK